MNFVMWILNRIKRSLVGTGTWRWIQDYRHQIIREKAASIVITLLCGFVWWIIVASIPIFLEYDRATIGLIMKCALLAVPVFYVYNWLMALYDIYDGERKETFNRLKREYR